MHPNSNTSPGGHGASENGQVVDGVRRVWGTIQGCSYRTVLSTLQRLTTVAENVEVRRKFKKRGNTEVRWWFLIRGEETVLQKTQRHGSLNVATNQFPSLLLSIWLLKEIMATSQYTKQPAKRMVRALFCPIINCKLSYAGCLL